MQTEKPIIPNPIHCQEGFHGPDYEAHRFPNGWYYVKVDKDFKSLPDIDAMVATFEMIQDKKTPWVGPFNSLETLQAAV
ncbi:hypothetical protein LCGC14_0145230 [marine sediment metagenome]|uniref:Uncharacterized protein n=1 Tax=marine sediment metagenome TaxID=412755 RepID=A0A0F9V379_9ZZZZ